MDVVVSVVAVGVGAVVPLVTLAAVVRWRLARMATVRPLPRVVVPIRVEPEPSAVPQHALDWVGATIGAKPTSPLLTDEPAERRCPHCHSTVQEGWFYCRRCGSRLFGA
jgi:hypothetical protein